MFSLISTIVINLTIGLNDYCGAPGVLISGDCTWKIKKAAVVSLRSKKLMDEIYIIFKTYE